MESTMAQPDRKLFEKLKGMQGLRCGEYNTDYADQSWPASRQCLSTCIEPTSGMGARVHGGAGRLV
jgi:hypothetical protein